MRVPGEKKKAVCNGINQLIGNLNAAAGLCNIAPNAIEFSFDLWCKPVGH